MRKRSRPKFSCSDCGARVTRQQEEDLFREDSIYFRVHCRVCDKRLTIDTVDVAVLSSCKKFYQLEEVYKANWHHTTFRQRWLEAMQDLIITPALHVGTYEAAMERTKTAPAEYRYVVRVRSDAIIDPEVQPDFNDWPYNGRHLKYDVIRYVNRYESPGSISLLVLPRALELVTYYHLKGDHGNAD